MKKSLSILLILLITAGCSNEVGNIENLEIRSHSFLEPMYMDDYYPKNLVDKSKNVLIKLCADIEKTNPSTTEELLNITHAATDQFNELMYEFQDQGIDLETIAREAIASDIAFILSTYGYDVDIEDAIATREW